MSATEPDIFGYLDYRTYLADAFAALRRCSRRFSYREFARRAALTSPNLLQLIINGSRDLAEKQVDPVAAVIGLKKKETDFLRDLVRFGNAHTQQQRDAALRRLQTNRKYGTIRALERDRYEYISRWYLPAVRELVAHAEFDGTPGWIAVRIHPRITPAQARRAIALLERLGLIGVDPATGRHVQRDAVVATAAQVEDLAAAGYHRAVLGLAADSIDAFDPGDRKLYAVTVGLSSAKVREFQERVEAFWRELLRAAAEPCPVETVYQVSLAAFPLYRKDTGDERT